MIRSIIVTFSLTWAAIASTSIALADDASDIQAVVTANLKARGFQHPGVYYEFDLTTSLPFAYVQALLGTSGNGGMTYALSKTSGSGRILGSGGGYMVPSILVDFGMPKATAEALQGFACLQDPTSLENRKRPKVTYFSTSLATKQLVAKRGPSVLPQRTVITRYEGRLQSVTIMKPLSGRICSGV